MKSPRVAKNCPRARGHQVDNHEQSIRFLWSIRSCPACVPSILDCRRRLEWRVGEQVRANGNNHPRLSPDHPQLHHQPRAGSVCPVCVAVFALRVSLFPCTGSMPCVCAKRDWTCGDQMSIGEMPIASLLCMIIDLEHRLRRGFDGALKSMEVCTPC